MLRLILLVIGGVVGLLALLVWAPKFLIKVCGFVAYLAFVICQAAFKAARWAADFVVGFQQGYHNS